MYSCLEFELFEHLFFLVQDFSLLVVSCPTGLHLYVSWWGGGGFFFFYFLFSLQMGQMSVVLRKWVLGKQPVALWRYASPKFVLFCLQTSILGMLIYIDIRRDCLEYVLLVCLEYILLAKWVSFLWLGILRGGFVQEDFLCLRFCTWLLLDSCWQRSEHCIVTAGQSQFTSTCVLWLDDAGGFPLLIGWTASG